jgi:PhzF family phenazine biosynthesis protein
VDPEIMKFYIVDAFADELFGGNGAGVVVLEPGEPFPAEIVMLKTAAELKFSETVFVQPQDEWTFKLRYFSPAAEVDLCGHATIGAFGAMRDCGMVKSGRNYHIETLAGKLLVEVGEKTILMEMGTPKDIATIDEEIKIAEIADIMGVSPTEIGMPPQIISTGLPDIMLHLKSKVALWRVDPDFPALAELSRRYEVVGVHAFAVPAPEESLPGGKVTAYCRNFAPLYEIDEEAATGTANGALTYYMYQKGMLAPGGENTFVQGEMMRRPSRISSRLTSLGVDTPEQRVKIMVGGNCKVLVRGEILLEH